MVFGVLLRALSGLISIIILQFGEIGLVVLLFKVCSIVENRQWNVHKIRIMLKGL